MLLKPHYHSQERDYNATTNVEAANITLTGQQGGEDLTVTGAGSITSGNVGSGKTANVTVNSGEWCIWNTGNSIKLYVYRRNTNLRCNSSSTHNLWIKRI